MTLIEFLLARIAEDEAVALAANGPRWGHGDGNVSTGGLYSLAPGEDDGWSIAWFELGTANADARGRRVLPRWATMERRAHENSVHAARHDPARVLAECAAKRRIVEHAQDWAETLHEVPSGWTEETATAYRMAMDWTLRVLAQPYHDHPAFNQEWIS